MKLDFFVIGTQKGGSTFLLNCLREHPDIYMPATEVAFFEDCFYDPDRMDGFEAWFDSAREGQILGVKRPDMLGHPEFPARIHSHYPDLKHIAILRDPIERAVSAYYHYMAARFIPMEPIEKGMQILLDGGWEDYPRAHQIIEFGLFDKHLAALEEYYPREKVFVLVFDRIKKDPAGALGELYRFVGVRDDFEAPSLNSRPMKSPYSTLLVRYNRLTSPLVNRWSEKGGYQIKRSNPLSRFARYPIAVGRKIVDKVVTNPGRPRLSPELHSRFLQRYMSDIESLEKRIGEDLSSWKAS